MCVGCVPECLCVCVCVCVCVRERHWGKKSLWAFGSSTGEDKVVWGLLTRPMIHNWGRTAVAGCTDRSQGGWQMIGPSGAELSISPNVHCPLSAHLSFISLPGICKRCGHRCAIWLNAGRKKLLHYHTPHNFPIQMSILLNRWDVPGSQFKNNSNVDYINIY